MREHVENGESETARIIRLMMGRVAKAQARSLRWNRPRGLLNSHVPTPALDPKAGSSFHSISRQAGRLEHRERLTMALDGMARPTDPIRRPAIPVGDASSSGPDPAGSELTSRGQGWRMGPGPSLRCS